jgi:hypothetical protein
MTFLYQKVEPRGSANFRPGSNPQHEDEVMSQADSNNTIPIKHAMCPPPRPSWDTVNDVDHRLHELKYMAEFVAELAQGLNGVEEGNFRIRYDEGNRLAFCCFEMLRRIKDAIETVNACGGKAVQS